jgi:hypothetical protein
MEGMTLLDFPSDSSKKTTPFNAGNYHEAIGKSMMRHFSWAGKSSTFHRLAREGSCPVDRRHKLLYHNH